jgi:hypothetical protein
LDIFMAKIRTADDPKGVGIFYITVSRIETMLIAVMMAFWVPFFIYFI